jgi:hypothetical protein
MGGRKALHRLIDDSPEQDLPVAVRVLEGLRATSDPVLRALLTAPLDDERDEDDVDGGLRSETRGSGRQRHLARRGQARVGPRPVGSLDIAGRRFGAEELTVKEKARPRAAGLSSSGEQDRVSAPSGLTQPRSSDPSTWPGSWLLPDPPQKRAPPLAVSSYEVARSPVLPQCTLRLRRTV